MARTPILWNHDHSSEPIGYVTQHDDGLLHFHFNKDVRISEEMFKEVFGHIGYVVHNMELMLDGTRVIRSGAILEFSLNRA